MKAKHTPAPKGRYWLCPECQGEGRELAYDREDPPGFQDGSNARCAMCGGATVVEPHIVLGDKRQAKDLTEAQLIEATLRWEIALQQWMEGSNGTCRKCKQVSGERRSLMVNYAREPARVMMWCKDCSIASTVGLIELPEEKQR